MKSTLLVGLFVVPCFAAITNLTVVSVTPTQAHLTYTAPNTSACTVQVSESSGYVPLSYDVDPGIFTGSDSDNRAGNLGAGTTSRTIVAGKHNVPQKQDAGTNVGVYRSRALASNTLYHLKITCGTDTAETTFTTQNPPMGATYGEALQELDRTNPGFIPRPYMDPSNPTECVIDPYNGLKHCKLIGPGNLPVVLAGQAYDSAKSFDASWTNPGNAVATGANFTTVTTGAGKLSIGVQNLTIPYGTGTAGHDGEIVQGGGLDFWQGQADIKVTGGTGAATVLMCRAIGGTCVETPSSHGIATTLATVTHGAYNANETNLTGADPALWKTAPPLNRGHMYPHKGSVTSNGASPSVLTFASGDYFDTAWDITSKIGLSAVSIADACNDASGTRTEYTVVSLSSAKVLTASAGSPLAAGTYYYCASNFRLLIWRTDANGGTVSVNNAKYSTNWSNAGSFLDAAGPSIFSGVKLNGGYYVASQNRELWHYNTDTGVVTLIGSMHVNQRFSGPDTWGTHRGGTESSPFDDAATQATGRLTWYTAAYSNAEGQYIILKVELEGTPAYQNNYDGVIDEGAGIVKTYPSNTVMTASNHGMTATYTIATPAGSGRDIGSLGALLHGSQGFLGILGQSGNKIGLGWRTNAESIAAIVALDVAAGTVINTTDTFSSPSCRWCMTHSFTSFPWPFITATPMGRNSTPGYGKDGMIVRNTNVLPTLAGTNVACPTNSIGAPTTGTACFNVTIAPHTFNGIAPTTANPYAPYDVKLPTTYGDFIQEAAVNDIVWATTNSAAYYADVVNSQWSGGGMFTILAISTNTWTVYPRHAADCTGGGTGCAEYNQADWPGLAANGYLFLTCNNIFRQSPTPPAGGGPWGDAAWDYVNNAWVYDKVPIMTHGTYIWGLGTSSIMAAAGETRNSCGISGANGGDSYDCYQVRGGMDMPNLFTAPAMTYPTAGAPFNGVSPSLLGYQQHPQVTQYGWLVDGRPVGSGIDAGSYALTTCAGSACGYTYKRGTNPSIDIKNQAWYAGSGAQAWIDVSGPNSVIDDSTPYSRCIVYKTNECSDSSHARATTVGQVYVSAPGRTHTYCTGGGSATSNFLPDSGNLADGICVNNSWVYGNSFLQFRLDGSGGRVFTYMANRGWDGMYALNARVSTDGAYVVWPWSNPDQSERMYVMATKMPPMPASDGVDRTTFVPVSVTAPAGPAGTANAVVKFGYLENGGTTANPYCTSRQEVCVKGAQAGNSYGFAGDAVTGVSCAAGCTISNVPAIPGRMLYGVISYRNGSNVEIGTSQFVTATAAGTGIPPVSDTTPPTISITTPTSGTTYGTASNTVSIAGTAADDTGVTSVTWTNSAGGSGTATGTTSWSASITLASGLNTLTVVAHDAAGNASTAVTLAVTLGPATSLRVTSGSSSLTIPGPYNAGTQPMRWEMRVHSLTPGIGLPAPDFGFIFLGDSGVGGNPSGPALISWGAMGTGYGDTITTSFTGLDNTVLGSDVLMRIQRDTGKVNCPLSPLGCYTIEICDTRGGNCQSRTANITTLATSWNPGAPFWVKAGADVAFIRWYSTVIPMGAAVPIGDTTGDLGDWEFQGNMDDSSGNGHAFTGGSPQFVPTPKYSPICNPGAQQSFRAGHPGSLDGSGSMPLDEGSNLTYLWQQVQGVSPADVRWVTPRGTPPGPYRSVRAGAKPTIDGMTFGSYDFQLTVTDGSGQSSSCIVHHGAVATDDAGVVILDNAPATALLGPGMQLGRNPWPWMDDRQTAMAAVQMTNIDNAYENFWDALAPGTVSLVHNSTAVTGTGTHFTTDICQGPDSPTVPKSKLMIIVHWNAEGNRRGFFATSCTDDTHLTLDSGYAWNLPSESGVTYALDDTVWLTWGVSQAGAPANYYDNVAAFYSLYYRTGIDTYLTYARRLADRFWASPMMDKGQAIPSLEGTGSPLAYAGRSQGILGMVLRALDGKPEMWPGLRNHWDNDLYIMNSNAWTDRGLPGMWDQREQSLNTMRVALCALYDPDATYRANCKTALATNFTALWKAVHDHFGDYSFPGWNGNVGSWSSGSQFLNTPITAVHGSDVVTLTSGTWTATNFGGGGGVNFSQIHIWMWDGDPAARPLLNSGGDPITYTLTYRDATHAVLTDRYGNATTYQGTTGNKGWEGLIGGDVPVLGWTVQPFMLGIISSALDLAAQAMADGDYSPTLAQSFRDYAAGANQYLISYGYRPSTKGMYYFVGGVDCPPGAVPEDYWVCTGSGTPSSPSASRILSAEGMRGMMFNWLNNGKDPALKASIDALVNAEFAKPGTCPSGSTVCVSDGYYLEQIDDRGEFMIGAVPAPQWFGMTFGFNPQSSWPAMRLGGAQPVSNRQVFIGFNLAGVPGATGVRVTATAPSGHRTDTDCRTSPCAVSIDGRQGDYSFQLRYMKDNGQVLAATEFPVIAAR